MILILTRLLDPPNFSWLILNFGLRRNFEIYPLPPLRLDLDPVFNTFQCISIHLNTFQYISIHFNAFSIYFSTKQIHFNVFQIQDPPEVNYRESFSAGPGWLRIHFDYRLQFSTIPGWLRLPFRTTDHTCTISKYFALRAAFFFINPYEKHVLC